MSKRKILVADNNPGHLAGIAKLLKSKDYTVHIANSPVEARKILEGGKIDLAILDIRLLNDEDEEDISGLELAKEFVLALPIIIMSRFPSSELISDVFNTHRDTPVATAFWNIDLGTDELVKLIARLINRPPTTEEEMILEESIQLHKQAQEFFGKQVVLILKIQKVFLVLI